MINVWYDIHKFLKEPCSLSQFSPIWGNHFLYQEGQMQHLKHGLPEDLKELMRFTHQSLISLCHLWNCNLNLIWIKTLF